MQAVRPMEEVCSGLQHQSGLMVAGPLYLKGHHNNYYPVGTGLISMDSWVRYNFFAIEETIIMTYI